MNKVQTFNNKKNKFIILIIHCLFYNQFKVVNLKRLSTFRMRGNLFIIKNGHRIINGKNKLSPN